MDSDEESIPKDIDDNDIHDHHHHEDEGHDHEHEHGGINHTISNSKKLNNDIKDDNNMKSSIMRVLVATDNHLGYLERDPIRGDDSFNSFEEILQYAHSMKVDMVLLGGDLFHDNKPSRSCLYRTIELFRKYCLGDSPVKIQFLSDQTVNFSNKFHTVNYEDPNFNISLPVFSIHGNHDDPTGEGGLAALDLLSVSNLVNYFGKTDNIDDISVYPLLLSKGDTKIAIYGLGNIRDERLYRTFQKQQVKMMRPIESKDEWFNILVLHQNRVAHNPKNYVHEQMIDNFIDFVVWGHEHECLINPQPSSIGEFHITQPGSSVATALSEGESKDKFVGLLEVFKNQFRFKQFPLKTVRPFVIDNIILADSKINPAQQQEVLEYIEKKVEDMIAKAKEKAKGKPSEKMLPLIRLKIDYTGYSTINPQKFGQNFAGRVANPNDILLFTRKKVTSVPKNQPNFYDNEKKSDDKIRVEDFISEFLGNTASDRLNILSEADLHIALHNFVDKEENDSILNLVNLSINKTQQFLKTKVAPSDSHQTFIYKVVDDNLPLNVLATEKPTLATPIPTQASNSKSIKMEDDEDIHKYAVDEDEEEDSHKNDHHGGDAPDDDDSSSEDDLFNVNNTNIFKTPASATKKSAPSPAVKKETPRKSTYSPYRTPSKSASQSSSMDDSVTIVLSSDSDSESKSTPKKRGKKQSTPTSLSKKSKN